MRSADVILDTYPFGGCNTSFSSFSMGIPIVTMPSDHINGRFTHGLYQKMGITEMVASNIKEYVNIANKCAMDKVWRKYISDKILDNIHRIFNEVDSINTWIHFCVQAINGVLENKSPLFIDTNKDFEETFNNSPAVFIATRSPCFEIAIDKRSCDFIKDDIVRISQIIDPSDALKESSLLS